MRNGTLFRAAAGGALAAGLCFAVEGAADAPARRDVVVITQSSNGRFVNLKNGQSVVVRLPANLDTGYIWELDVVDATILRPEGAPRYVGAPGSRTSGGVQSFRFETLRNGVTPLTLASPPPRGGGSGRIFAVRVTVR